MKLSLFVFVGSLLLLETARAHDLFYKEVKEDDLPDVVPIARKFAATRRHWNNHIHRNMHYEHFNTENQDTIHLATKKLKSVQCPDKQSECPDGSTCCKLASGQYGCCPLVNATCCSDMVHCCPNGYKCDVSAGTCIKGENEVFHVKININKVSKVVCPNQQNECPDGSTCCKLASGQYGCCPLVNATCCSDMIHCCPNGYKCDVAAGSCIKGQYQKPPVKIPKTVPNKVVCPDQQSECPDGSTCCKLASGQYGCCPLVNATCCSDMVHCCPNGYKCDVSAGSCIKGQRQTSLFKLPQSVKNLPNKVVCPDQQSECPDGSTCCKLASGQYGCCPLVKATCCSDMIHCCPNGYKCDVSAGSCIKGQRQTYLFKLPKAVPNKVVCPDQQSECPDGSTCCKLASGQYGCCPLVNATCCSDMVHCCPNGYKCDVSAGSCIKGNSFRIPVQMPKAILKKVSKVVCPDQQSECPDGSTCCKLASGQYGCCPLVNATCCSDMVHCCPNGYKCDVSAGSCIKGNSFRIPVQIPKAIPKKVSKVVCPDQQSECPDGSTCCKLASGQYGCCPLVNATCCSDMVHCCPNGYKCDVSAGSCIKGTSQKLFLNTVQSCGKFKGTNGILCCPKRMLFDFNKQECKFP